MSADESRPAISRSTHVYIAIVVALATLSFALALHVGSWPPLGILLALLALSALVWFVGDSRVEAHVGVSLVGILLLASAVLLGPLGAGIVGLLVAGLSRDPQPWSARVFNMALSGLLGTVAGFTYAWAGGSSDLQGLRGLGPTVTQLGVPLLVADLAQLVVNVVLIVGIMRVSQGVPVRLTAARLLVTMGVFSLGYGLLAILLVLLWLPTGLGPFSVLLLFVPLIGAQWALGQYTAQRQAQEEYLDLLVAAIELRLPERAGRAARVGDVCRRMAEHLGLGVAQVQDIARAGLLHDLPAAARPVPGGRWHVDGQRIGRGSASVSTVAPAPRLLDGVTFLTGAARVLRERQAEAGGASPASLAAQIVDLAVAHDEATVRSGGGLDLDAFCQQWARDHDALPRVVDALRWTVARAGSQS